MIPGAVLTMREPEGQPDFGAVVHDIGARRHDANDFMESTIDFHGLVE